MWIAFQKASAIDADFLDKIKNYPNIVIAR
jgi:hypothetical protein